MDEMKSYGEAVRYLIELPLFTQKNEPANTRHLMELLGHPEEHFKVIHIAGTNGKGSTCAFLACIFQEAGLKTGLFTSPHLVRINERMQIDGCMIPDEDFRKAFGRVSHAVSILKEEGGQEPTCFETLFAMAMCWFEEQKIDLLVCETGLGGRLDATNTIRKAEAEVITSIGLDHTKYLGDTVEQIASEKAGIIRKKVPCIYSAKDPASAGVIRETCMRMEAIPVPLEKEAYRIVERTQRSLKVRLTVPDGRVLDLTVPFNAAYQAENACLAALCALTLGVKEDMVQRAIAHTRWPGRMEQIRKDVYLDGAHNPDGIREIAREIRHIARTRKVHLLTAVVSDKDHGEMVRELCDGVRYESVIVTTAGWRRKLDPQILAGEFLASGQGCVRCVEDARQAYEEACRDKGDGVLFCVGSLYLIGEIKYAEL